MLHTNNTTTIEQFHKFFKSKIVPLIIEAIGCVSGFLHETPLDILGIACSVVATPQRSEILGTCKAQ